MLRLSARLGLFMTALFSTVTVALSRSDAGPLDNRWQVAFIAHVAEVGLRGRVMNADGTDIQTLSLAGHPVYYFDCSPDGRAFAFVSGGWAYLTEANGNNLHRVEARSVSPIDLSLSNDGDAIIFNGTARESDSVYLVDSGNWYEIAGQLPTRGYGYGTMYDLSPDGRRIAYHLPPEAVLYVASVNGNVYGRLPGAAFGASWSPDGTMVAFAADWDGNFEIYVLDVARLITRQLTNQSRGYGNTFPAWSPDGRHLVFVHTNATGLGSSYGGELHVVNMAGKGERLLARFNDEVIAACLLEARPTLLAEGS
jgi:Tol biopolymer transport system component